MPDSKQKADLEQRAQVLIQDELGYELRQLGYDDVPSYQTLRSKKFLGFIEFYLSAKSLKEAKALPDINHHVCKKLLIIDQSRV